MNHPPSVPEAEKAKFDQLIEAGHIFVLDRGKGNLTSIVCDEARQKKSAEGPRMGVKLNGNRLELPCTQYKDGVCQVLNGGTCRLETLSEIPITEIQKT